jgi:hypothetical protein
MPPYSVHFFGSSSLGGLSLLRLGISRQLSVFLDETPIDKPRIRRDRFGETRDVHHVSWFSLLLAGITRVPENVPAPARRPVAWVSPPAPETAPLIPSDPRRGPLNRGPTSESKFKARVRTARVRTPTLQPILTAFRGVKVRRCSQNEVRNGFRGLASSISHRPPGWK